MEIIKKKLKDLKFAPYNPRKISTRMASSLKKSIKEFGYSDPMVWNKQTGHVVGGNQRLSALKDMKKPEDEVQVVMVDMDLKREKAMNIALNKINGDWDEEKLIGLFNDMPDTNTRDLTGFIEPELEILLSPNKMKEYDENVETKNKCPKCNYEW